MSVYIVLYSEAILLKRRKMSGRHYNQILYLLSQPKSNLNQSDQEYEIIKQLIHRGCLHLNP